MSKNKLEINDVWESDFYEIMVIEAISDVYGRTINRNKHNGNFFL